MAARPFSKNLTERQKAFWEAFKDLTGKQGSPPSVRDLARRFDIDVAVAYRHLKTLVRKGFLEASVRGFRLPGAAVIPVPVLGRVPAGSPQEPLPAPESYLPCPAEWGRARDLFALRVRGDSMTGLGVMDNDLVVCARGASVKEGNIIVAMVDGEATVKQLGKAQGRPALLPANSRYKPIPLRGGIRVTIVGKVLGVFRSIGK